MEDLWLPLALALFAVVMSVLLYSRKSRPANPIYVPEIPLSQLPHGFVRELSPVERGFKYITDTGVGIIGSSLVLRAEREVSREILAGMVDMLWQQKPLLRVCIVKHPEKLNQRNLFFKQLPDAKKEEVLIDCGTLDKDIVSELQSRICEPFDAENGPLWRVLCFDMPEQISNLDQDESDDVNNNSLSHIKALIMVFNHTICDGIAVTELYRISCLYLHQVLSQSQPPKLPHVTRSDVTPAPVESLVPNIRFPFWFEVAGALGAKLMTLSNIIPFRHQFLHEVIPPMITDSDVKPAPRILRHTFNSTITAKLISETKRQKSTFSGTLGAILAIAINSFMYNKDASSSESTIHTVTKKTSFRIVIPVDLRKFFTSHYYDEHVANYISVSPLAVKCTIEPMKPGQSQSEYFWALSRSISAEIHRLLRNSETIKAIRVVTPMLDDEQFIDRMMKKAATHKQSGGRIALFSISNLGIIKSPEPEANRRPYRVDQLTFGANETFGGSIFSNNVATYDGRLMWNMVTATHIISDHTAKSVMANISTTVRDFPFTL